MTTQPPAAASTARSDWFDGLTLTHESDATTLLQGPVIDRAALHGLLQKLRDTGLPLISVTAVKPVASHPENPSNEGTTTATALRISIGPAGCGRSFRGWRQRRGWRPKTGPRLPSNAPSLDPESTSIPAEIS